MGACWQACWPRIGMSKQHIPHRGDVYWINPDPIAGREMKGTHRFVVITPKEINALGIVTTIPITSGGIFSRNAGVTVSISGHDTTGVAVCNHIRSFDIEARVRAGSARYIETLDTWTTDEIINRVISIIDPAE
jgi:mRNA interferase ChpB